MAQTFRLIPETETPPAAAPADTTKPVLKLKPVAAPADSSQGPVVSGTEVSAAKPAATATTQPLGGPIAADSSLTPDAVIPVHPAPEEPAGEQPSTQQSGGPVTTVRNAKTGKVISTTSENSRWRFPDSAFHSGTQTPITDRESALNFVVSDRIEGKYVNHPADAGGPTNHGISTVLLNDLHKQDPEHWKNYPTDVYYLTPEQAKQIYREVFWPPVANLPENIRLMAFDVAVLHGVPRALQWYHQYGTDMQKWIDRRRDEYEKTANEKPSQRAFFRGWNNRLMAFNQFDWSAKNNGNQPAIAAQPDVQPTVAAADQTKTAPGTTDDPNIPRISESGKPMTVASSEQMTTGTDGKPIIAPEVGGIETSAKHPITEYWDKQRDWIREQYANFAKMGDDLFKMSPELVKKFEDMIAGEQNRKDPNEINPWAAAVMGFVNPDKAEKFVQQRHAEVMQSFNTRMSNIQRMKEAALDAQYKSEMAAGNWKAALRTNEVMAQVAAGTAEATARSTMLENKLAREAASRDRQEKLKLSWDQAMLNIKAKLAEIQYKMTDSDQKMLMGIFNSLANLSDVTGDVYAANPAALGAKALEMFVQMKKSLHEEIPNGAGTGAGAGAGAGSSKPDPKLTGRTIQGPPMPS